MFEMTYGSKPSTPVKRYIHIPTNNYKCPKQVLYVCTQILQIVVYSIYGSAKCACCKSGQLKIVCVFVCRRAGTTPVNSVSIKQRRVGPSPLRSGIHASSKRGNTTTASQKRPTGLPVSSSSLNTH